MKKLFTFIFAVFFGIGSCWGATTSILLSEPFARNAGTLNSGTSSSIGSNKTNWYNILGTNNIQVVDTSLTFSGYQNTASGRAVEYIGNVGSDIRAFTSSKNSGTVFMSCIVRMKNPAKNSTGTTISPFISMASEVSTSKEFGRILYQPSGSGFKVAPGKYTESATYLRWSDELQINKEYLLILSYTFVSGTKNDEVSLWINPTKDDVSKPTIIQKKDTTTGGGSAAGTNSRDDAASLGYVILASGSYAPKDIIIDEVRVATSWNDLFEKDAPTPILNATCTNKDFGTFSAEYEPQQTTITVTGSDLKADVTITPAVGVDVYPTSLKKAAVMASGGAVVTVTSNANFSSYGNSITFSSTDATSKSITITGTPVSFASRTSIQDMNNNTAIGGYASLNVNSTKIESVNPSNSTFVIGSSYSATINYESVPGTYAVNGTISGLKVKKTGTDTYKAFTFTYNAPVVAGITIAENADNSAILAENDGVTTTVNFTRSFTKDTYNTICLPITVSKSIIESKFGYGCSLIKLSSSSYAGGVITLGFTEVSDNLEAGKPYLIKPTQTVTNPSFTNYVVSKSLDTIQTTYVDFIPLMSPTELQHSKEILFLGTNNELFWPTETGTMKGLRCYFLVKFTGTPISAGAPVRMSISSTDGTTEIFEMQNTQSTIQKAQKVLRNNQLIIERGNKQYTIQGQEIK